jgi:hypothetical protein
LQISASGFLILAIPSLVLILAILSMVLVLAFFLVTA